MVFQIREPWVFSCWIIWIHANYIWIPLLPHVSSSFQVSYGYSALSYILLQWHGRFVLDMVHIMIYRHPWTKWHHKRALRRGLWSYWHGRWKFSCCKSSQMASIGSQWSAILLSPFLNDRRRPSLESRVLSQLPRRFLNTLVKLAGYNAGKRCHGLWYSVNLTLCIGVWERCVCRMKQTDVISFHCFIFLVK